ncbi:hypothetical protein [Micromonospora carbonacea]|uniref:Uncharacterized protein n=1 Tax=Micromonospora carbonacea TaxID=47853 RepID=A0A1C5AM88_9ACTN|nr:hypothetical protein [Micromonospora carbonacea]SCF46345.1 hypothetical protein GA0070563_114171 [Micromonospora carbonacea]
MTEEAATTPEPWSPAHHPEAIAVSEAQWWVWTLRLCAHRLDEQELGLWLPDPRQVDARQFVVALRQVEYATRLMLKGTLLDGCPAARSELETARQRFLAKVPGVIAARDILIHFHDYALGEGNRQNKQKQRDGAAAAARDHWGGGYNPATGEFRLGPHRINIKLALEEAEVLFDAIYMAAKAFDDYQAAQREASTS